LEIAKRTTVIETVVKKNTLSSFRRMPTLDSIETPKLLKKIRMSYVVSKKFQKKCQCCEMFQNKIILSVYSKAAVRFKCLHAKQVINNLFLSVGKIND
tara:strand:+ start:311 stop:604 length:294 start_codon:yes stop_codon:yes gene_type:complete